MSKANDKIDLGLDRMLKLMQKLIPTKSGLVELPAIHIAGTNGKGSVSAMLESALLNTGLRVGRYNSPHFIDVWDCIRLNGKSVSKRRYEKARKKVQAASDDEGINATPFEILTATAFFIFKEKEWQDVDLDVVIIECGMGGARDATNILDPEWVWAYVLTSVSLDHQSFLGNTIAEITKEKLGIVPTSTFPHQYATLIVAPQLHEDAQREIHRLKTERRFDFVFSEFDFSRARGLEFSLDPFIEPKHDVIELPAVLQDYEFKDNLHAVSVPFPGYHQRANAAAVMEVLHQLDIAKKPSINRSRFPWFFKYDPMLALKGVEKAVWPGRCSWIETNRGHVLADGAHNDASAELLRKHINQLMTIWVPAGTYGDRKVTFIVALSHSPPKTPESILEPLVKPGDRVVAVDFTPPEGMPWVKPVPTNDIYQAIKVPYIYPEEYRNSTPTLQQAIDWAMAPKEKAMVVVCGSLYLVADLYRLYPQDNVLDAKVGKGPEAN